MRRRRRCTAPERGDGSRLPCRQNMARLDADDTFEWAICGEDPHALAGKDHLGRMPETGESQKAIVAHRRHKESDFVGMRRDHDSWSVGRCPCHSPVDVPPDVLLDLLAVRTEMTRHVPQHRLFESGRGIERGQTLQVAEQNVGRVGRLVAIRRGSHKAGVSSLKVRAGQRESTTERRCEFECILACGGW